MEAFFSILLSFLVLIIGAASFYNLIAVPVGIVLVILKALKKIKYRWRTILLIGFGGIGVVVLAFIFNFIINFVMALFGINMPPMTLPSQS